MTDQPNHEIPDELKKHLEHISDSCTMISRLLNVDLECPDEKMSGIVRQQVRMLFDNLSRIKGSTTDLASKTKDLPN